MTGVVADQLGAGKCHDAHVLVPENRDKTLAINAGPMFCQLAKR